MLKRVWNVVISVIIGLVTYGALSFIEFRFPVLATILVAVTWTEFFEIMPRRRCGRKKNFDSIKKEEIE